MWQAEAKGKAIRGCAQCAHGNLDGDQELFAQFPTQLTGVHRMSEIKVRRSLCGRGAMIGGRGHSVEQWLMKLEEHQWACFWCRGVLTENSATKDHLQPISRGGNDLIDNIVPCCRLCNSKKGNRTGQEYFDALSPEAQRVVQSCQQVSFFNSSDLRFEEERMRELKQVINEAAPGSWAWKNPAR